MLSIKVTVRSNAVMTFTQSVMQCLSHYMKLEKFGKKVCMCSSPLLLKKHNWHGHELPLPIVVPC